MTRPRLNFGDLAGLREGVSFLLLAIAVVVSMSLSPYFLNAQNLSFTATDALEIGIIALPMTLVMVMGEIDLSVGSTVGLSVAVMGSLSAHHVPFAFSILATLLTGLAAGLLNQYLCARFKLPSLVITLGTFALYRGLAEVILGAGTTSSFPSWFTGWDARYVASHVTYPQMAFVGMAVIFVVLLHRMRFGRIAYFIGGNAVAARYAGLKVNRAKSVAFGLTGLAAALSGIILASRLQSVDSTTGTGLELTVITAVLLGGTDFRGGKGTIIGTLIAVILEGVVQNGLQLGGFSAQITTAIIGGLLVISFVLDAGSTAIRSKSRRLRANQTRRPPLTPIADGSY